MTGVNMLRPAGLIDRQVHRRAARQVDPALVKVTCSNRSEAHGYEGLVKRSRGDRAPGPEASVALNIRFRAAD